MGPNFTQRTSRHYFAFAESQADLPLTTAAQNRALNTHNHLQTISVIFAGVLHPVGADPATLSNRPTASKDVRIVSFHGAFTEFEQTDDGLFLFFFKQTPSRKDSRGVQRTHSHLHSHTATVIMGGTYHRQVWGLSTKTRKWTRLTKQNKKNQNPPTL